ncbi:hypothetical protein FOA52_000882 [Chlamydomonas sp. UWO 241]|nr:hypothetical protein FOA52_000882 [Chlamydomonas sp. UWO 241]
MSIASIKRYIWKKSDLVFHFLRRDPLNPAPLQAASDSEEEESATQAAKRLKGVGKPKVKLTDYLPAPKNAGEGNMLGGGTGGGPGKRPAAAAAKLPPDFFGGGADGGSAGGSGRGAYGGGGGGGGGGGNEAYRIDDGAATGAAAVQHPADAYTVDAGPSLAPADYASYYPATAHNSGGPSKSWDGSGGSGGSGAQQKAGGGGGGGKKPLAADEFELPVELAGVQFKEVSQASLRYVAPGQAAEQGGLASALGSDYANQLRAQAATCKGTGKANQKHQIGTLLHNAKMAEIDMLEGKSRGMKTKRETQAKYGW